MQHISQHLRYLQEEFFPFVKKLSVCIQKSISNYAKPLLLQDLTDLPHKKTLRSAPAIDFWVFFLLFVGM